MDKNKSIDKHSTYQKPDKDVWTGRKTDPKKAPQYWYQTIQCVDLKADLSIDQDSKQKFALLGYVCDEGVRRNQGRVGAAAGPAALRSALAKVALHFDKKSIFDVGNVVCIDNHLEACQKRFNKVISTLLSKNIKPIAIGGGHDIAFAHFNGIFDHVQGTTNSTIGIINFDAHFDLRPVEHNGNSGTPFHQINHLLKEKNLPFHYCIVGIQPQSNTKELFDIARQNNVEHILYSDCLMSNISGIKNQLNDFISKIDHLYITVDMDGFSSAYAAGVSAPSPLGFDPLFFFAIFEHLLKSKKVISIDIAELNPTYDRDGQTANLASKIVDFAVCNW
ncbi:MAG: formimidoylglutamase [Chitinophagales bacterium]